MIEKSKQLTLSQRNRIEEMLNQRRRKFEIANELDKTQSTIAREINRHKILKPHNIYKSSNLFNCKFFVNCKVCTNKCRIFQPISCKDRDRNIGVCNNYGNVIRVKGFYLNNDEWYLFNATKEEITKEKIDLGQDVVIIIGSSLNEEEINKLVNSI